MIVDRIWTGNAYRNFNYLIACPDTGRSAGHRPARSRQVPGPGQGQRLAHHPDPQHPRAPRPHRRQCRGGRRDGGQGDRPRQGRGPHRRRRPRRGGRRRHQGRQAGRARMPRHAGPHDVPHLPALAHRPAGALLRRHAVQRRRRQLPQRRRPGADVRHLRAPAGDAAGRHPASTRATTTSRTTSSSRSTASPTTPPRRRACRA